MSPLDKKIEINSRHRISARRRIRESREMMMTKECSSLFSLSLPLLTKIALKYDEKTKIRRKVLFPSFLECVCVNEIVENGEGGDQCLSDRLLRRSVLTINFQ